MHCDVCHKSDESMITVVWNHGIIYSCEDCYEKKNDEWILGLAKEIMEEHREVLIALSRI